MKTVNRVEVGPHGFRPLRFWDALRGDGRCQACFLPRSAHPIHNAWVPARPMGDTRKAELTWTNPSSQRQEQQ